MMHILYSFLYILLLGLLNHVRGGMLQKFYHNTMLWKLLAAFLVGLDSWLVLGLGPVYGMALGALWWAFMLPPWASWFDMGLLPSDTSRNNWLLTYPYKLVLGDFPDQPKVVDAIMMFLRGLWSIVIFIPIAYVRGEPLLALLVIPCAFLWMLGYAVDRWCIKKNWSEYIAGAVIGLFIVWGVIL